jgi:hypothetical protein
MRHAEMAQTRERGPIANFGTEGDTIASKMGPSSLEEKEGKRVLEKHTDKKKNVPAS